MKKLLIILIVFMFLLSTFACAGGVDVNTDNGEGELNNANDDGNNANDNEVNDENDGDGNSNDENNSDIYDVDDMDNTLDDNEL